MGGDPARQRQGQTRQQGAVRSDPVNERLWRSSGHITGRTQHDPKRLPPAEFDQHRLAVLEIGQRRRNSVGVRPCPTGPGGIDRHLDQPPLTRGDSASRLVPGLQPEGHRR